VNEQQLVDRLARTAEMLPDPADTSLARIQSRAHARRRRRQVLAVAAVMPVVTILAVAVAQLLPAGPQQPIIEPLGEGPERVAPLELADDAVWRSPEVADVTEAVEIFAEQALGWSDVSVELGTEEVGPVWVTIVGPEQRTVEGLFTPTPDEGVWQLMELGDPPGVQYLDSWSVTIRPPTAAVSADLFVRYEAQTWHLPLDGEHLQREVQFADYGLPEGGQIDAMLILYRDAAGTTLHAVGGHYGTGTDAVDPDPFPADTELTEQFVSEFTACMAEHDVVVERVEAIVSSERALLLRGWSTSSPPPESDPETDCENLVMNQMGLHPYIDGE
jgi:hypothetical protein